MIKTLTTVGNSSAILLDRTIMELVGLSEKDQVNVTVSGGAVILTPVRPTVDRARLEAAAEKVMAKYGRLLERLA